MFVWLLLSFQVHFLTFEVHFIVDFSGREEEEGDKGVGDEEEGGDGDEGVGDDEEEEDRVCSEYM